MGDKKTKNILFLIQDKKMPSSRVRVCNLLSELKLNGIESEVVKYPSNVLDKLKIFSKCRNFDAVFLQKRLLTPLDTWLLRKFSKYLIFDFDDSIFCKHDSENVDYKSNRYLKFKHVVSSADLIIAGNQYLAKYALELNSNVAIVPSAVFVKNVPQKDYSQSSGKVIIGWLGGCINLPYLDMLSPVLRELAKHYDIELRIICDKTLAVPGVEVKFVPWMLESQDHEVAKFDIGLMPLADSLHARGKCGYKALQYMAAGVVPVVSDVGMNKDIVLDGESGFVAKKVDDFYPALEKLIVNPALREVMGKSARKRIEDVYSIEAVGSLLANEINSRLIKIKV